MYLPQMSQKGKIFLKKNSENLIMKVIKRIFAQILKDLPVVIKEPLQEKEFLRMLRLVQ